MAVWKHRGKWRAAYNRKHLGTFDYKRDAEQAVVNYRAGLVSEKSTMTVAEWRGRWLQQQQVRASTLSWYEERTKAFTKAYGKRPLDEVRPVEAIEWAAANPSTIAVVHRMFRAAVDAELITKSPFKSVSAPKYKRKIEAGWMTIDDVTRLEQAAEACAPSGIGPILRAMVTVAAWTGVRPGELWALDPTDIGPNRLHIRGSIDSKTGLVGPTKNGRDRVVVLPKPAQIAIANMDPTIAFLFEGYRPPALFPTLRGTRWTSPAWSFHWKTIRTAAGMAPKTAFYELRHFAATRLLEAGVSVEDVAHQLGHTDGGKLVVSTYGHPDVRHAEDRLAAAMEKMAAADADRLAPIIELRSVKSDGTAG